MLRLGSGIPLIYFAIENVLRTAPGGPVYVVLHLAGGLAGTLLIIGLWTPIAGGFVAGTQLWTLFSRPFPEHGYPFAQIFLLVLGGALALLGPGAWSVDARLFGRKLFVQDLEPRSR